ncbi:MAG: NAD-dependent epimerase/dehydratase family protein [Gammaproteobacteria bacterium]|nr:NAD-dependent epimerase/dehydratase family protein [Gammaproteobacteria bacterium]
MTVLIMGATGFLGKRVAKKLDEKKVAYVKLSKSLGVDFTNFETFISTVKSIPAKINAIVNCAALVGGIKYGLEHTGEMFYVNSLISLNLYEVARQLGISKVINPISNCSYPRDLTGQFTEKEWWNGELDDSVAVYGMVRKMSYIQSVAYLKQYGINTINLIVPNMYGPEDHFDEVRSHALGALIRKITAAKSKGEEKVIVWGTGSPIREWLYVDDCAEAIYRSLTSPDTIEPINLGCGKGISIKELAFLIADIVDYKGELYFDATKPNGAPYKVMDVTRCSDYFRWLPSMPIKEGIRHSVEWLNAEANILHVA